MKFDDLVSMVMEANNDPAPEGSEADQGGKFYFCEVATKAIKNAQANGGKYPYMERVMTKYADAIKKLTSIGVGKLNYSTLKKVNMDGDTYELTTLELPNGEKVENFPIALSVEIDDEQVQNELGKKYEKMELRNVANKEAGGGEAGKRAEDFLTALG